MEFCNKRTGVRLRASFRPFRPTDAPMIAACIREEYEESYVKPALYTPSRLVDLWRAQELVFTVCEGEKGDFIGMLGMERSRLFSGQCEYVTQVIREPFKGFGIARAHIAYNMQITARAGYSALYGHALTVHNRSQITLHRCGFRECGYIFGLFDAHILHTVAFRPAAPKISQAILVLPQEKRDAGTLYLDPDCVSLAAMIYGGLGVPWRAGAALDRSAPWGEESRILTLDDREQKTRSLYIRRAGAGFREEIAGLVRGAGNAPLQVINAFLDVSRPEAARGYRALTALGFHVSGMQPLCADAEYLVLHRPHKDGMPLEGICTTEDFRPLTEEIKRLWRLA